MTNRERILRNIAKSVKDARDLLCEPGNEVLKEYYKEQLKFLRNEVYDERLIYNPRLKRKEIRL